MAGEEDHLALTLLSALWFEFSLEESGLQKLLVASGTTWIYNSAPRLTLTAWILGSTIGYRKLRLISSNGLDHSVNTKRSST